MSQQEILEAPSLCFGSSDVGSPCEKYIYFKLLVKLKTISIDDDKYTKRIVTVYYYEDPICAEGAGQQAPPPEKGIVIEEEERDRNEYGQTTQTRISLKFLPIDYKLA